MKENKVANKNIDDKMARLLAFTNRFLINVALSYYVESSWILVRKMQHVNWTRPHKHVILYILDFI